jgi:hypothetical protein
MKGNDKWMTFPHGGGEWLDAGYNMIIFIINVGDDYLKGIFD